MVLRLQAVSWSRHCIFMSEQCLLFCHDNVATEVFVSWPRRPGQVAPFVLQHVWSWQRFLCRSKVLLCRNRVWSRPKVSMSRQSISVSLQSLALGRDFMLRQSVFMPRQSLVKTKSFRLRQSVFVSRQCLVKARSFYVATEYSCAAIEFGLGWGFSVATLSIFFPQPSLGKGIREFTSQHSVLCRESGARHCVAARLHARDRHARLR